MVLDRLIRTLFLLGVIAIPFDAIPGFGALGELSGEASFYFFFPAIGFAICLMLARLHRLRPHLTRPSLLAGVACGIATVFLVTTIANLPIILDAKFHDRSGINKLLTSTIVLGYGLLLAWLASSILPARWQSHLIRPVSISAMLCLAYSALEFLNRLGVPIPMYEALNGLVHAGSDQLVQSWNGAINLKLLEGWDQRLRSVSFEPPAFGNFSGYAWPWLLAGMLGASGGARLRAACLLGAFTLLIILAQARTGHLLLASNGLVFLAMRFLYAPPHGRSRPVLVGVVTISGAIIVVFGLAMLSIRVDQFTAAVVAGNSVSDLSRLAYQTSAFAMFASNPLFGVGFGQFAFHALEFMPAWAYFSPEVSASLIQPAAPWPNTYSLYARIASETGLIGLAAWVALWLSAAAFLIRDGVAYARRFGGLPFVVYPLVMNCFGVLVVGITTDTLRTPMLWIALGGTSAVLTSVRQRLAAIENGQGGAA